VSRKDAILQFFRAHLKFLARFALAALLVSLVAGSVLYYRYRTGPGYVFKSLRAALNEADRAELATIIDFRSLSEDIVAAVLAVYPQAATNEMQKAEMRDEAQRQALKALAVKPGAKQETALPRKLFEPLPFLPEDFIAQFAAGMKLEKTADNARIHSHFTHNGLQANFPVRLLMEHRPGGWLVTRLLNAPELVNLYKGAMDVIRTEDEAKLAEKNAQTIAKMRTYFDSPQCLAAMNPVSDRLEVMLVIKVTAQNTSATTLHNVNILCDVRAGDGTQAYERQLNVVQRVDGGGSFSNTWTVLLDSNGPEAAKLLQAGPLSCTVEPKVMSVGAGEMLYLRTD
jgi:hypothetical protein